MSEAEFLVIESLAGVDQAQWQALAGDNPTLSWQFLHALHETGAAAPRTGWTPRYLVLHRDGVLHGAMPLYLKDHSRGEYESLCRDNGVHLLIDHSNLPLDKGLSAVAMVNQ